MIFRTRKFWIPTLLAAGFLINAYLFGTGYIESVVDRRLQEPHAPGYYQLINAPSELSHQYMLLAANREGIWRNAATLRAIQASELGFYHSALRLHQELDQAYMQREFRLANELRGNLWLFMETQTGQVRGNHTAIVFHDDEGRAVGIAPWPTNDLVAYGL